MTTNSGQLRKDILQKRDELVSSEIELSSEKVCERLLAIPEVKAAKTIFAYVSFRSEIATFQLIEQFLNQGKTTTVPITHVKEKRLDAIRINDLEEDLVPGYCNIPEPTADLCKSNIVAPQEIEVILLPGSVFDKRGGRFGYGGGFYDRFVSAVPKAIRIGLAFDLQIVDKLALQPHDELLDYIVSPSELYIGTRQS